VDVKDSQRSVGDSTLEGYIFHKRAKEGIKDAGVNFMQQGPVRGATKVPAREMFGPVNLCGVPKESDPLLSLGKKKKNTNLRQGKRKRNWWDPDWARIQALSWVVMKSIVQLRNVNPGGQKLV